MSKATKIVNSEEKIAALQLADQIKKIKFAGSKYLKAQIACEETPKEYSDACEAELQARYDKEEEQDSGPAQEDVEENKQIENEGENYDS